MAENKNISPEEMEEEILENEEINDTAEEETVEEAEEAVAEEPETEKEKGSFFEKEREERQKRSRRSKNLQTESERQMAEFDNFRKRTEKEKTQMFETGAKSIVEKILPVVDNFERGLAAVTGGRKRNSFRGRYGKNLQADDDCAGGSRSKTD